ncbi:MAG TPA: HD domain-containing protein [Gemmatimonadales bacterium]|nr:HD domain-containing protein [Gemmatimonadales bacterium]
MGYPAADFEIVRDPLWSNIRIDAEALEVLDSEPFQRLRYIRQLGHAFLVYPGATHTRFEHALGAFHLARRALALLAERGDLQGIPEDEITLVRLAALLHDVGHYPFSHALEEAGLPSHETLAVEHLAHPDLRTTLERTRVTSPARRIAALISGTSTSPLQGLISGSLDLDKIEYLTRDARMCGVPYGAVDVDRLLHSMTLVAVPGQGTRVAVLEKGASALESLLFAKYQMYRNVYWHHAVRSATAMFKRLVRDAIAAGRLEAAWIARSTDEALMERLHALGDMPLAQRLRRRRLYKRSLDLPATDLPPTAGAWMAEEPDLAAQVEDRLAADLRLGRGELLLDFPAKADMLRLDLLFVTRTGELAPAQVGLQRVAESLHQVARRLRVFTTEPRPLHPGQMLAIAEMDAAAVRDALSRGGRLLG